MTGTNPSEFSSLLLAFGIPEFGWQIVYGRDHGSPS